MAASPPSSFYNHWVDFERQFEEEESMSTRGPKVNPFIGDVLSTKKQNIVGDANYNRASNEHDVENANTMAVNPFDQGWLMPQIPFNFEAFDDDDMCFPTPATPPSSLYNPWTDFVNQIEEQSISTNTNEPREDLFIGDVWRSKKRKMVGDTSSNRESNEFVMVNVNSLAVVPNETHVPIDVEALDDDVVVSSSVDFARAKNKSRIAREGAVVIDIESEEQMNTIAPSSRNKLRIDPSGLAIIDCDRYYLLDGPRQIIEENIERLQPPNIEIMQPPPLPTLLPPPPPPALPPPPPPPMEPAYSCPICMCSIEEAMTTKCGHIFCKSCLKAAISAQKKCPTCRSKVATMRSTFRVYLPTTR